MLSDLPCKVSNNLSQINLTIKLPLGWQRRLSENYHEELNDDDDLFDLDNGRLLQSVGTIVSGETVEFRVTSIKNPFSFMPTDDTLQYTVYTDNGFMIEHTDFSYDLKINNTVEGEFDPNKTAAMPSDFRQNVRANYTLTFSPLNYQQNMKIVVTLPNEINFTNETLICEGMAGTDSPMIDCKVDKKTKKITITDAVTYQRGNPGTIKFNFYQLVNPIENIITNSFKIETYTNLGYPLDIIKTNVTVNFYCEYPCQSCNQDEKSTCNECYRPSDFDIWFNSQCLEICPDGWVNTSTFNCT